MLNLNQCTKTKPKPNPTVNLKNSSYVCIIVHNRHIQHSTEQFW